LAIRKCPSCLTVVPAGKVVAFSNDLVCPGCHRPVGISPVSRDFAIAAALVVAAAVWRWSAGRAGDSLLGWALPIVYAFLAFGVVAPLVLMASADLRLREAAPVPPETHVDATHGAASSNH
jgi:hypothetical protein